MRTIRLLTLAAAAIVASGCAAAMNVSSHVEPGLDLSRYHTFAWGPRDALPTGDPRLDANPVFQDHMMGGVLKELSARGMTLGDARTADLLIHYHASITERIDVNRVDRGYGYCTQGDCPAETREYEAGTIVLDFIDARSGRLIWRGWAQRSIGKMLDSSDAVADTADRAVTRMLQQLPVHP